MARFTIDGRDYTVRYMVVERYRPGTFWDPPEGTVEPEQEVEVPGGGTITYDEFVRLYTEERFGDGDDPENREITELRVADELWREYLRDLKDPPIY